MTDQTTSGDPWHKFRAPKDMWDAYEKLVGERGRSAGVRNLIQWQLDHPTADLSAVPTNRRHVILVVIDETADDSGGTTISIAPGTANAGSEDYRRQVEAALVEYRKNHPRRARKAGQ